MFIDMRILHANATIDGGSMLSPMPIKKNCMYQSVPPAAEKAIFLNSTVEGTDR